jgi:GAF domain-containing protein
VLALGDRAGRQFHPDEILLAQGVVEQGTLALENARLYAEARYANRVNSSRSSRASPAVERYAPSRRTSANTREATSIASRAAGAPT